ncbi:MAG: Gldg family protein, partial [Lentisphaeria bacterium]|nr:Gldg family protein [Lentisphaeria bacterium]
LQIHTGERIYLGLAVSCADRYVPIPFLSMQQEKLLEYEIVRAILNVTNPVKPRIGVMSAFKVTGDRLPEQLTQLDAETPKIYERAWYVISELSNDYEIVKLDLDLQEIPQDLASLLVIHPAGIRERTLYALDQYLMNGGKMAVFLDPRSFYAVIKTRTDYSMLNKISSSLEPLTGAWGVAYNPNMIVTDLLFAHRKTLPDRMVTNPAALELTPEALNQEDPVTARFKTLSMWFSSVLEFQEVKGIRTKVLIHSSPNSQAVSSYVGERPELILRYFRPSGKKMPLALQLSGNFPSAYPNGPPHLMGTGHRHKKESAGKGMVYLFGDSDMLFNDLCVKTVPDVYGQQTVVRQNDNCALLQHIMEQLTDTDSSLKWIRSRKPMQRPLTRYNELRAKAELAYKDRIRDLEKDLLRARAGERKIRQKLKDAPGGKENALTESERKILRQYENSRARVQRELREIRKQLRADLNALDTKLRVINMVLLPLFLALCGLAWAFLRFSRWRRKKGGSAVK